MSENLLLMAVVVLCMIFVLLGCSYEVLKDIREAIKNQK
jgi:hypothetical protein